MTEQQKVDSPLVEAQTLVTGLQTQAGSIDAAELKAQLSHLADLIGQAVRSGEGQAAEQLRAELEKVGQESAAFTSVMVHEIRKPMTSIRGYSDMLAKPDMIGPLNDMQKQFVETIRNNIISMEGLVTDISDISKLTSGRLKPENKMTMFGQVIMDVQKQVEPMVAKFEHQIAWEVPQGLPFLNADAKLLAKALVKLVQNALQYTPPGTGQIVVKAERLDDNVLHVEVIDNGIGMKAEDVARMGELFFRADHELVTSQKGYGLGVPIAVNVLSGMGSRLEVTSEPDKGSAFGFRLTGMG